LSWISNVVRPKIRSLLNKREVAQNLWTKCPETGEMVFHRDLEANHFVIPGSGYHMRMTTKQRLDHFFGEDAYEQIALPDVPVDPLKFRDERRYTERLRDARAKTGAVDAVLQLPDGVGVVARSPFTRFGSPRHRGGRHRGRGSTSRAAARPLHALAALAEPLDSSLGDRL